jgi:hypothetical protein
LNIAALLCWWFRYERYKIDELGCLNELRGELQVHNLEEVKDKEEAEKAKLDRKANICELGLKWSSRREKKRRKKSATPMMRMCWKASSLTQT